MISDQRWQKKSFVIYADQAWWHKYDEITMMTLYDDLLSSGERWKEIPERDCRHGRGGWCHHKATFPSFVAFYLLSPILCHLFFCHTYYLVTHFLLSPILFCHPSSFVTHFLKLISFSHFIHQSHQAKLTLIITGRATSCFCQEPVSFSLMTSILPLQSPICLRIEIPPGPELRYLLP